MSTTPNYINSLSLLEDVGAFNDADRDDVRDALYADEIDRNQEERVIEMITGGYSYAQ